jgi:hypothetical protein
MGDKKSLKSALSPDPSPTRGRGEIIIRPEYQGQMPLLIANPLISKLLIRRANSTNVIPVEAGISDVQSTPIIGLDGSPGQSGMTGFIVFSGRINSKRDRKKQTLFSLSMVTYCLRM